MNEDLLNYHLFNGYARVSACTPEVILGHPMRNARNIIHMLHKLNDNFSDISVFPELCLTGYSMEDLFHQAALQKDVEEAVDLLRHQNIKHLYVVGAPIRFEGALYNCAVVIFGDRILGVVPKTYLPNYKEFYERRYFASGAGVVGKTIRIGDSVVPFGVDLIFSADNKDVNVHVEICEDVWTAIPPSSYAALAGANVILNLSASNITIGKGEARHKLCASQSSRCIAAYAYSAAGFGESTNDLAWDGQAMIYENGCLLVDSPRFVGGNRFIQADVDLDLLRQERSRTVTFNDSKVQNSPVDFCFQTFKFSRRYENTNLLRKLDRFPFVPSDQSRLNEDCYEAYNIQVHALVQRLKSSGVKKLVLGVSGGLDSTHALIVAARAFDYLGYPRSDILGFSLPGFGTGSSTRGNSHALMKALGVTAEEIDIRESANLMLKAIGHPYASGEPVYDVTFENVQAGLRTDYLFRIANLRGGMVLGTGDMSELALGWCTYGVGDHMSHYGVNAGVPKTLIQYLVRWVVREDIFGSEANKVLQSILDTEISPELIPADAVGMQSSESKVGPYSLQDFNLYYLIGRGYAPSKVAFLAYHAWVKGDGNWPAGFPEGAKSNVTFDEVKHWLEIFIKRFFANQFKRTAIPNGPKVCSGGSLSPRGDWRAPSDAGCALWLEDLSRNT